MENIIKASVQQLQRVQHCISLFSAYEYSSPLPYLLDSTIGMHLRHVIEFYKHLLEAEYMGTNLVNYDARERSIILERHPEQALAAISTLIGGIEKLKSDKTMVLQCSCDIDSEKKEYINTSLVRELAYNLEHCIHHLAIVKVAINIYFPEKALPSDFGVAYATQRHAQNA